MSLSQPKKRVALLGLMLESNSFAPVTSRDDFLNRLYVAGDEFRAELNRTESKLPAELLSFHAAMDGAVEWEPVPILIGLVEAGGPLDHTFFEETLSEMSARLQAAMPLDGVYICNHGAMITTEDRDPDGTIFEMIRGVVGPDVPVVATLDLHGNVSDRMVQAANVVIAYQTNPHVDMIARGQDAAGALNEMFHGLRPGAAMIRLPVTPPTVTLLTETGPYADLIRYARTKVTDDILNISILGGFAYADTPKNGLAIIVTTRSGKHAAHKLAIEIAEHAWQDHERYVPALIPLEKAVAAAVRAGEDMTLGPVILADVADNPGGGANGNTTWILEALVRAGAKGGVLGIFNDPALAAQAMELGEGARFRAIFNRNAPDQYSHRFEVDATVLRIRDGDCVGRRGFYAGRRINVGTTALLDLDGVRVVVISIRTQCADPVFLEMMGIDIAKARSVVVKSRGHFRAGFDEFFTPDQVIEVDAPGLSSPVLSRFDFKYLPRPIFPIDRNVSWPPRLSALAL
ncbi:M81 family metallopeptidase [Mesorhizobium sp. M00.F.Ca.ET.216.01.1.1]|uniref:M81 family metallopeptidase n=1 Tax=Mesorhizobium sp. M00.F.Ca.ET.216.01.1.1 TaxID=2500528 RepID=UPI000FD9F3BA|nr:M81 family metallopeptidase [Mesorhizobium sp. M00.F.Ca.ET.216.01.1.1]TGQ39432.1 M81 family peptidase [Mesorhizobium sp. M00.F.Ca.ET.216.01.1.1]